MTIVVMDQTSLPNCEHDCSLALEAFNQSLICNGKIGNKTCLKKIGLVHPKKTASNRSKISPINYFALKKLGPVHAK